MCSLVASSRHRGPDADDGLGHGAATAGRVEIVELAVLQALVGHAAAAGARGERHRGAVAVQHEHRLRMDPGRHLRLDPADVAPAAVDLDVIAVADAQRPGAVGVDPEHLFRRDLVEQRVVEGLAVRQRRRPCEQQVEAVVRRRRLGLVGRQARQPGLLQDLALDLDLARGGREPELLARVSVGALARLTNPASRISATVTPVPSSW